MKSSFFSSNVFGILFFAFIFSIIGISIKCSSRDPKWIIEAQIAGRIREVSISRGTDYFKLEGDNTSYAIQTEANPKHPSIDTLRRPLANPLAYFSGVAEKGDSLFKAKNSDSVFVIRNNRRYGWRILH